VFNNLNYGFSIQVVEKIITSDVFNFLVYYIIITIVIFWIFF